LAYKPYTKSVDWWSFGVMIFEMLTGQVCSNPLLFKRKLLKFMSLLKSIYQVDTEI